MIAHIKARFIELVSDRSELFNHEQLQFCDCLAGLRRSVTGMGCTEPPFMAITYRVL